MKTIEKIIIAAVVGTTLMTFYSYRKAKRENSEFVEPVLINKLVDNSKHLPEMPVSHPTGWLIHYSIGIGFVAAYWLIWQNALHKPTLLKTAVIGSASGLIGIVTWKLIFAQHDNPPKNDREAYYKQLFTAHIIFSATALATYKRLDDMERNSLRD